MKPKEKCELCKEEWASYQLQTVVGKKEVCKTCATLVYKESLKND